MVAALNKNIEIHKKFSFIFFKFHASLSRIMEVVIVFCHSFYPKLLNLLANNLKNNGFCHRLIGSSVVFQKPPFH